MKRAVKRLIDGQHIFRQTIIEGEYEVQEKMRRDADYFSGVPHLVTGIDDKSPWIICLPTIKGAKIKRRYVFPLTDYPKLHHEFGDINPADSEQIVNFVRQYGFLGYSFQMNKVDELAKSSQAVYVESLRRWQEEILLMQHCLSLWKQSYTGGASTDADINWLQQHVVWDTKGIDILYPGPDRTHHFRLCGPAQNQNIYRLMESNGHEELEKFTIPAQTYVIQRINEHLFSNMDMSLQPFIKRKDYKIIITPKNLLSTMWYLFMKEILGIHYEGKTLRYCSECGKPLLGRMSAQTCNDKCRQRRRRRMQNMPKIS